MSIIEAICDIIVKIYKNILQLRSKGLVVSDEELERINSMEFSKRIHRLIELASKHDPNLYIFGASKHKYKLNPPASIEEIRDFEKEYHIVIPEALMKFLTEVGNGGAGIDYGLYSLEQMRINNKHLINGSNNGKVIVDYEDIKQEWNKIIDKIDKCNDVASINLSDEERQNNNKIYEELLGQLLKGFLVIGTAGCTCDYVIICEGEHCGEIAVMDWNLMKDYQPILCNNDFETWMCQYFTNIIKGNIIKQYNDLWLVNNI